MFNTDGTLGYADPPETPASAGVQQLRVTADSMITRTVKYVSRSGYIRSGHVLTLAYPGGRTTALRIQELTGTRLVLAFEERYSAGYGGGLGQQVLYEYSR